jgi:hypothetical protein
MEMECKSKNLTENNQFDDHFFVLCNSVQSVLPISYTPDQPNYCQLLAH